MSFDSHREGNGTPLQYSCNAFSYSAFHDTSAEKKILTQPNHTRVWSLDRQHQHSWDLVRNINS